MRIVRAYKSISKQNTLNTNDEASAIEVKVDIDVLQKQVI
jgi:hypothetical protein